MQNCCLFAWYVINWYTICYLSQTSNYCNMNHPYRFIDVRIINSWNKCWLCFHDQWLLNNPNAFYILDILVELWINSHMLWSYRKTFLMLLFIIDAYYERYARWILFHHIYHESNCQMHSFNNHWFISSVIVFNNVFKLCLNLSTLFFIAN